MLSNPVTPIFPGAINNTLQPFSQKTVYEMKNGH